MKAYLISLILLIFCMMPNIPAKAANITGTQLQAYCESSDPKDVMSCANYIAGIIDYHVFMKSMGAEPAFGFCIPDNVTIEEISFIVMKYLQNIPEQGGFIAVQTVLMALNREYPCGGQTYNQE